jgi:prepilin-type N-terminal cleavage/methylation domain-containing protein
MCTYSHWKFLVASRAPTYDYIDANFQHIADMPLCPAQKQRTQTSTAFTLIELLVVIAIIAILAGLLLPTLAAAKEKGKRTACKNNMHQALLACHMYGNDFQERVPSGRENQGNWHAIRISGAGWTNLVQYSGNEKILDCPNISFNTNIVGRYSSTYGFIIGYQYLGDAIPTSTPNFQYPWISPKKLTDGPSLTLLADANHWGNDGFLIVPHRKSGLFQEMGSSFTYLGRGWPPVVFGAAGGNVGYLDGSVIWKTMFQMKTNQASSYVFYFGNW